MANSNNNNNSKTILPRTKFTEIEDIKLLNIVRPMEKINWKHVSSLFGNRTARQCRERYNNYLAPTVQNKTWTKEEDEILLQKYSIYGPQWSLLTKFFINRAAVNIKNHYTRLIGSTTKNVLSENINSSTQLNIESPKTDAIDDETVSIGPVNEEIQQVKDTEIDIEADENSFNDDIDIYENSFFLEEDPYFSVAYAS